MDRTQSISEPTREVFGNISPWMQAVFYGLMLASLGSLAWQVAGRVRLWRRGRPGGFEMDWRIWIRRLAVHAVAQKRVHRKSVGAALHLLLFSGFVVLAIGTTLLAIADQGPVNFHRGWYYLFYELSMDVFGVALCLGCLLALYRRIAHRPASLGHRRTDWFLLGILLALCVTGFVLEALRLHYTEVEANVARWSVIGHAIDQALLGGIDESSARQLHLWTWWLHAVLVAVFFACIPVTRFLHVLTGPAHIAVAPSRPRGALSPLSLEEVESTGEVGVSMVGQFGRHQLLSLDACMECGRCEDACPAWASGKPLSPKNLVVDLREAMSSGHEGPLQGEVILHDTLWACTMCQACVQECPVHIDHVDIVSDLRRHLVAEGQIAGPPAQALSRIGRQSNPFGRPPSDRLAWAQGLSVPTIEENPDCEYLLWVGCAAAFDPRAQKIARSVVTLLQAAGVDFAVLGKEERCTGDPARRCGDEFLFQEMAQSNVETLQTHRIRKIITPCPHCMNTLKKEYAQFGGEFEVKHHSQFLNELIRDNRLRVSARRRADITMHDPCYLARVDGETEAPRNVVTSATQSPIREMPRSRAKTSCCGAGGGRMWFDEPLEERVSHLRAQEAFATGAGTVATACPFCMNMMTDAVGATAGGEEKKVLDVAEILVEGLETLPGGSGAGEGSGHG